ncbi:MAG TPA: malto-oligosyltrehalose trehalohydrolase [Vicinamibacterales bacterium]|nr:malto-oligosyltrehalose trehalohydrolase [Vicinamibacterales bacterium]
MALVTAERRLPCGAEVQKGGGTHVRVWAPACRQVDLVVAGGNPVRLRLERDPDGHHAGFIPALGPGGRYWLALDGERLRPDPCSRYQPEGPHGPSQVVDPDAFRWSDRAWTGLGRDGHVLYEMHIGTFTPESTWRAAMEQLPALAQLGISVIEMMPVAEFPGRFGWGYDGVDLYAPMHRYGTPDDLRAFVDCAHALGLGVILDVVYNHLGPDGNYLADFSPDYFTDRYENDWGRALNFEGPSAARELFVANAGYWIDEFHFDGLRLDASQDIHDRSPEHMIRSIAARVREAARGRGTWIIAENEPQERILLDDPATGGYGLDALWNDDFHHSAIVAMTGRREAYYHDYQGTPQELISCAKYGFLYQGQYYAWQKKRRGTPTLDMPPSRFVAYLENHDQLANSAFGRRLHQLTAPARHRALTAMLLLGPATPMLFQGQEFNASSPFLYFADQKAELHGPIRQGRREFLSQFASLEDPELTPQLPSPVDPANFERSKLDPGERASNAAAVALHRDLIALRRQDPVIGQKARRIDGAVLAAEAFVLRFFGGGAGDRLLLVNLGCDLDLTPAPEPLLAPPAGAGWQVIWSSEAVRYGGQGTAPLNPDRQWHLPGECAVLLSALGGERA